MNGDLTSEQATEVERVAIVLHRSLYRVTSHDQTPWHDLKPESQKFYIAMANDVLKTHAVIPRTDLQALRAELEQMRQERDDVNQRLIAFYAIHTETNERLKELLQVSANAGRMLVKAEARAERAEADLEDLPHWRNLAMACMEVARERDEAQQIAVDGWRAARQEADRARSLSDTLRTLLYAVKSWGEQANDFDGGMPDAVLDAYKAAEKAVAPPSVGTSPSL